MKKKRSLKYVEICNRAAGMGVIQEDREAMMDVFCGIQNHIKRDVFLTKSFGSFIPRFASENKIPNDN